MKCNSARCHAAAGFWTFGLVTVLFLSSCAGLQGKRQSPKTPAENLSQIGIRQASVSREKLRPDILVTLIKKAEQQIHLKELDAAFTTLEQAIGIDAQDPVVWHLMAWVKLSQGNLQQAEHLAKKSNLLAAQNLSLQKKNWDIIARSLDQQGRAHEAMEAQKKAQE